MSQLRQKGRFSIIPQELSTFLQEKPNCKNLSWYFPIFSEYLLSLSLMTYNAKDTIIMFEKEKFWSRDQYNIFSPKLRFDRGVDRGSCYSVSQMLLESTWVNLFKTQPRQTRLFLK